MKKLLAVVALVVGLIAATSNVEAQQAIFKGKAAGSVVKVAADGTAAVYDTGTATASAGAATLNADSGTITTESLTTAGLATYTLTLTNARVTTASKVFVNVSNGTNTQGTLGGSGNATPGAGSVVIKVTNLHATQALNGTLKVRFLVVNP